MILLNSDFDYQDLARNIFRWEFFKNDVIRENALNSVADKYNSEKNYPKLIKDMLLLTSKLVS